LASASDDKETAACSPELLLLPPAAHNVAAAADREPTPLPSPGTDTDPPHPACIPGVHGSASLCFGSDKIIKHTKRQSAFSCRNPNAPFKNSKKNEEASRHRRRGIPNLGSWSTGVGPSPSLLASPTERCGLSGAARPPVGNREGAPAQPLVGEDGVDVLPPSGGWRCRRGW
jgi:hypothetical protein